MKRLLAFAVNALAVLFSTLAMLLLVPAQATAGTPTD